MFSLFNLQGALQSRFHNFFSLSFGLIGFPRPKQLAHYSTSFSACQELFSFFSKLFSRLFRSPRSPAKRSAIISFHPRFVNYFFLFSSTFLVSLRAALSIVPQAARHPKIWMHSPAGPTLAALLFQTKCPQRAP